MFWPNQNIEIHESENKKDIISREIKTNNESLHEDLTLIDNIGIDTVVEFLNQEYKIGDTPVIINKNMINEARSFNNIELGLVDSNNKLVAYIINFILETSIHGVTYKNNHINNLCVSKRWGKKGLAQYLISEMMFRTSKLDIFLGYYMADFPVGSNSLPCMNWIYPINTRRMEHELKSVVKGSHSKIREYFELPYSTGVSWSKDIHETTGSFSICKDQLEKLNRETMKCEIALINNEPKVCFLWRTMNVVMNKREETIVKFMGLFCLNKCTTNDKVKAISSFVKRYKKEYLFIIFEQLGGVNKVFLENIKALPTNQRYFNLYNYSGVFKNEEINTIIY